MSHHRILKRARRTWSDVLDFEFLEYLSREIILLNPIQNCRIVGSPHDWDDLPHDKSLFHLPQGLGLPIGNLTSQLFSNVYLNELDQWMKRDMQCRHYGRYVDDFFVVSADRSFLLGLVEKVHSFLTTRLGLKLQQEKTVICDVRQGVPFLGAYLKPGRRYVENKTLRHMKSKLFELKEELESTGKATDKLEYALNAYLGVLGHYRSYNIRRELMLGIGVFSRYGCFSRDLKKYHQLAPQ